MAGEAVEVVIDEQGEVSVSVSGVAGSGCKALTKDLLEAIGGEQKTTLTGEYSKQAKGRRTVDAE